MKRKLLLFIFVIMGVLVFTGCENHNSLEFRRYYESVNGTTTKSGSERRSVKIDSSNPYIYISQEDIIKRIDNKETFILYVGDKLCPWCRSVVEKSIEVAKSEGIDKIYWTNIWDDEGNEIFRDKYILNSKGKKELVVEGTESYKKLLTICNDLLKDYTLTDEDGKTVEVGEKRIYAPNYILFVKGEAKKLVTGVSDKQKGSLDELTEEILKDEEEQFKELYKMYKESK